MNKKKKFNKFNKIKLYLQTNLMAFEHTLFLVSFALFKVGMVDCIWTVGFKSFFCSSILSFFSWSLIPSVLTESVLKLVNVVDNDDVSKEL